jgi:hypothetical protein
MATVILNAEITMIGLDDTVSTFSLRQPQGYSAPAKVWAAGPSG